MKGVYYNISSYEGFAQFFGSINNYMGGWFWSLMLVGMAITFFVLSLQRASVAKSFLASGFLTMLVSIFFFFLGWISWKILLLSIIAFIGGIVAAIFDEDREY